MKEKGEKGGSMVLGTLVVVSGRRIPAAVRVGATIFSTRTRSSSGFSFLAVSAISARRCPVKFSCNYYNGMKLSLSLCIPQLQSISSTTTERSYLLTVSGIFQTGLLLGFSKEI
jgi:hypothetical protein